MAYLCSANLFCKQRFILHTWRTLHREPSNLKITKVVLEFMKHEIKHPEMFWFVFNWRNEYNDGIYMNPLYEPLGLVPNQIDWQHSLRSL